MKIRSFFEDINKQQTKVLQRRNLKALCSEVVLLLLSAFLLSLSFPSFISERGWGFFAFFALIPLFAVIRNTNYRSVWFYGFFYGYMYYWIFNYWLAAFHPLANVLVQVIKGTEMIALFVCLKAADSLFSSKISYAVQACIWVAYTYLAQSWFAGYPYGTVAYALYRYKILIQIADFSGIWIINFLLVLPQAFLGSWLCDRISKSKCEKSEGLVTEILANKIVLGIWAIAVVFQIIYGICKYSYWHKTEPDTTFKIATVQHNADSWKGGYNTYKKNFNSLKKMSLEAKNKNPDMIVWSETAFVPSVSWYTSYPYEGNDKGSQFDYLRMIQVLVDEFVDFGNTLKIPLLTGNPSGVIKDATLPPYDSNGDWNKLDYNSVILFDEGKIKDTYLKQHLVPFTEHFPYEKQMPWLYNLLLANDYNWWEKGTESKVFRTSNGITFSTPICFEDIFGYLCAGFAKEGADLFINMTNDSWSGSVISEKQHAYMAVFRSIENRKTMLRSTNSGITCMILPDGTITDEMDPFVVGWRIWDVPVYSGASHRMTCYTRCADSIANVFVYVSYALLALGIVIKIKDIIRKEK